MYNFDRKKHWEHIYSTKLLEDVSWYQSTPTTSLDFLKQFNMSKTSKIVDIGGGDSLLVDHLIDMGYENITIVDISSAALERAKKRLGDKAKKVKWVVADAADFRPEDNYDFWHDRAAFHFLTEEADINHYIDTVSKHLTTDGVLVLGTFSEQGPKKCSGIDIKQYSEITMVERFKAYFEKVKCIAVDHTTPFNTVQNFIFCSFKKRAIAF